jgi:hypothetical protein
MHGPEQNQEACRSNPGFTLQEQLRAIHQFPD